MRLVLLALIAACLVACGTTRTVVRTVTVKQAPSTADQRLFGHIVSLDRSGSGYLMRFDPALLVSGVTANVAAAKDAGIACRPTQCEPVPNDNYELDETHRTLTFLVPASARGTVLVRSNLNFGGKTITAAELARIVAGRSTVKLFEPLESGVWITVHVDTVRRFEQQYRP